MNMSTTDTTVRQALLSVLLAILVVTAGCSGMLPGDSSSDGADAPASATAGSGENNSSTADGVDLRSISIPDNGSVTRSGELDGGDPMSGGKYYEPVQVAAVEGQVMNITMQAENGNPALRIVNPDGNVSAIVSSEDGTETGFLSGTFGQTGRYTIEPTSVSQNATFNYSLTVERAANTENEELLAGPMSTYNETEQYLRFARDVTLIGANLSDQDKETYSIDYVGTQFESSNVSGPDIQANASGDYAVITYKVGDNNTLSHLNDIEVAFAVSYMRMWEGYRDLGNDTTTARSEAWVPEIIFFRGLNETGELRQTHFITKEWAIQYSQTMNNDRYAAQYGSTKRLGPGEIHTDLDSPRVTPITDDEFPEAYWNHTFPDDNVTLAERYGL